MNPGLGGTTTLNEQWGESQDVPLGGFDLDGDGYSDSVIWRRGTQPDASQIWVKPTTGSQWGRNFGDGADVPFFSRDQNSDSKAEFWLYRVSSGTYFQLDSTTGYNWYNQFFTDQEVKDIPL